jgi:hypothetical protein
MEWIDPEKVVAGIVTGLVTKAITEGITYLKRVWTQHPPIKPHQLSILTPTFGAPFLKKPISTIYHFPDLIY